MRLREREMPLDPEIERELEASTAHWRRARRPRPRELAELARRCARSESPPSPACGRLDERVADGFPRPGRARTGLRRGCPRCRRPHPGAGGPRRRCSWSSAWGSPRAARSVTDGNERHQPASDARPADGGGGPGRRCADARGGGPAREAPSRDARARAAAPFAGPVERRARARRLPPAAQGGPERRPRALDRAGRFRDAADGVLDVVRVPRVRGPLERLRRRSRRPGSQRGHATSSFGSRRGAARRAGRSLGPRPRRLAHRRDPGRHEALRLRRSGSTLEETRQTCCASSGTR